MIPNLAKTVMIWPRKNLTPEIKVKELESKLTHYENPNSPPSADSLLWRKQKKNRESDSPSKPGQKDGHKGVNPLPQTN